MVNESNTAVCFSGHLRTFASNPLLRASTKQNLVDAIAAGGTADVFGVATLESSPRNNYNEREGLMAFVETFKPKRFTTVFESATSSYAQWGGEVPFPTREQMERLQGYYVWQEAPFAAVDVARSQYANVAACFDLVRAHESHERKRPATRSDLQHDPTTLARMCALFLDALLPTPTPPNSRPASQASSRKSSLTRSSSMEGSPSIISLSLVDFRLLV